VKVAVRLSAPTGSADVVRVAVPVVPLTVVLLEPSGVAPSRNATDPPTPAARLSDELTVAVSSTGEL
jgi:hypothetical protein